MANRARRVKQDIDYTELHNRGFQLQDMSDRGSEVDYEDDLDKMEDGQLADSPLQVVADDSEFQMDNAMSNNSLEADRTELISSGSTDPEVTLRAKEVGDRELEWSDVAVDDVWEKKQCDLQANRARREQLKLRLERQKQLVEERLREEQENLAMAKMEQEIQELEKRRLVCSCKFISRGAEVSRSRSKKGNNEGQLESHPCSSSRKQPSRQADSVVTDLRISIPEPTRYAHLSHPMTDDDRVCRWLESSEDIESIWEGVPETDFKNYDIPDNCAGDPDPMNEYLNDAIVDCRRDIERELGSRAHKSGKKTITAAAKPPQHGEAGS